jgi:hypothetical protein
MHNNAYYSISVTTSFERIVVALFIYTYNSKDLINSMNRLVLEELAAGQENSCLLRKPEVITGAKMKITVFWDVSKCSLVQNYQRFRETCYLHLQGGRVGQGRERENGKKYRERTST